MDNRDFPRNTIYTDYRAEFMVAALVEGGFPMDQVRLIRLGVSKGGKNMDSIEHAFSRDELIDFINVYTRKRDLYESLPEGLFHQRMSLNGQSGEKALVNSMEQGRREAFNARCFFRPFEMAIDRMSILAHLYEVCLEKKEMHDDFVHLLSHHWTILQSFPTQKALMLVHCIAVCHRMVDAKQIGNLLSLVLDCKVSVESKNEPVTYQTGGGWSLGMGFLGETTIVGNEVSVFSPMIIVRLQGLSIGRKELFAPHSDAIRQLKRVLNIFLPADAELDLQIEVKKDCGMFRLEESELSPILGYTTILS